MLMDPHEAMDAPPADAQLWRYMDFTKYVALLESRALMFSRADQFEDPYEGVFSTAGVRQLRELAGGATFTHENVELLVKWSGQQRRMMYLSCWHMSDYESAAMWKLYLKSNEGIAIRTDASKLAKFAAEASHNVGVSKVRYVDYDRTAVPMGNSFFPFVHKRLSFSHESEVRAIIWALDGRNETLIPSNSTNVSVPVAVEDFLISVHVSPTAPGWFGQLVEQVTRRYGFATPIVRSSLYDRPSI